MAQEMTCWGHGHGSPKAPCSVAVTALLRRTTCLVSSDMAAPFLLLEAKHSAPTLDTFLSPLDNALHFPVLIFFFVLIFCWLLHPSFVLQVCSLLIGWGPVLLTPALVMSGLQLCQRPELALSARLDREDGVRWRVE